MYGGYIQFNGKLKFVAFFPLLLIKLALLKITLYRRITFILRFFIVSYFKINFLSQICVMFLTFALTSPK